MKNVYVLSEEFYSDKFDSQRHLYRPGFGDFLNVLGDNEDTYIYDDGGQFRTFSEAQIEMKIEELVQIKVRVEKL